MRQLRIACWYGMVGYGVVGILCMQVAMSCVSPRRVITGTVSLDELTLALLQHAGKPELLVGVSYLADHDHHSWRPQAFVRVPHRVGAAIESVLAARADLALLSTYNRVQFYHQVAAAGTRILKTGSITRIVDLERVVLELSQRLCLPRTGQQVWQQFEQRLRHLQQRVRRPAAVLLMSLDGTVQGKGTLADDVLRVLGLTNVAAESGAVGWAKLQRESLAALRPELWVYPTTGEEVSPVRRNLRAVPYARHWPVQSQPQNFVAVPAALYSSASHHVLDLAEYLVRAVEERKVAG
ncbi:MAG: ABC transporter substrate-binding protein [Zetaproteobacteria bacterium]|nr:ABC transporter substrate-binding protein [Zetaproteobacteria bacterium]